ncbi:MAG: FliA/WhiG family RNA polymerase sigma factor [Acidobacteria bacterium]|nr:FliA/WhiG family RNA polymerase sigma factor [Acidobacteriota bacterium]
MATVFVLPTVTRPTYCSSVQQIQDVVAKSLPAVKFLASRLAARVPAAVEFDDLVQAGLVGLLQCADRFDPQRGVKFQTYANRRVQGAMLDYLRSLDWAPRSVRAKRRKLDQAVHTSEQRLGSNATQEDVAAEIGISIQELEQWTDGAAVPQAAVASDEASSATLEAVADPADSPEDILEKRQMRYLLIQAIEALPHDERMVLSLYYYEQLTMQEIADVMGVRQARISQIHTQAISRLRNRIRGALRGRRTPGIPGGAAPQPTAQANRLRRLANRPSTRTL